MSRILATPVTATVLNVFATCFVVLRVISRFYILKRSYADDYLIVLSLTMSWSLTGLIFARKLGNSLIKKDS